MNLAITRGGFGFNNLHYDFLRIQSISEIPPIKKVSITKKPLINLIMPIHCAAINPNVEIIKTACEISTEYTIPDEIFRKPIHYAAACMGPEPLNYLISQNVDIREGDINKITPLMIACIYGRDKNVKILLENVRCNPKSKSKEGFMAVHYAAKYGHLKVLKVFKKIFNTKKTSHLGIAGLFLFFCFV